MIWRKSLIFKMPRYLYLDKYQRYAQNNCLVVEYLRLALELQLPGSRISQAGTRIVTVWQQNISAWHQNFCARPPARTNKPLTSKSIHTRLVATKNADAHKLENVSVHSIHVYQYIQYMCMSTDMHAYCRTHKSLVCSHRCFAQRFYYQPVIFYYYQPVIFYYKSLVCSHRCFAQRFYYQPVIFYYYSTTITTTNRFPHTHTHTHILTHIPIRLDAQ